MSERFSRIPKVTRFNYYCSTEYAVDGPVMFGWVIKIHTDHELRYLGSTGCFSCLILTKY